MDHQERDNFVLLEGRAAGEPRYSHAARSQRVALLAQREREGAGDGSAL